MVFSRGLFSLNMLVCQNSYRIHYHGTRSMPDAIDVKYLYHFLIYYICIWVLLFEVYEGWSCTIQIAISHLCIPGYILCALSFMRSGEISLSQLLAVQAQVFCHFRKPAARTVVSTAPRHVLFWISLVVRQICGNYNISSSGSCLTCIYNPAWYFCSFSIQSTDGSSRSFQSVEIIK